MCEMLMQCANVALGWPKHDPYIQTREESDLALNCPTSTLFTLSTLDAKMKFCFYLIERFSSPPSSMVDHRTQEKQFMLLQKHSFDPEMWALLSKKTTSVAQQADK